MVETEERVAQVPQAAAAPLALVTQARGQREVPWSVLPGMVEVAEREAL